MEWALFWTWWLQIALWALLGIILAFLVSGVMLSIKSAWAEQQIENSAKWAELATDSERII